MNPKPYLIHPVTLCESCNMDDMLFYLENNTFSVQEIGEIPDSIEVWNKIDLYSYQAEIITVNILIYFFLVY